MGVMGEAPELAVVVDEDLAQWQKLNITAFVVSGLAATEPDLIGEPYVDGSAVSYLPMFAYPLIVLAGPSAKVRRAFHRAAERGLRSTVYTRDLFATGNDIDNREAVARVSTADLDVVGFAVAGPARVIDKALDGLRLHH
jgi:hypothetical protein